MTKRRESLSSQESRPERIYIDVNQHFDGDVSGEATGVKVDTMQGPVIFEGAVNITVPGLPAELVSRLTPGATPPPEDLRRPVIDRQLFEPETMCVPAGPFLMGADPGEGVPAYETPQHTLTLPAYRIARFPVTNREYAEFIRRETAQDVPKDPGWFLREPPPDRLDHPVTGVGWGDAVAYCRWVSSQTGRRYRLPDEAEWEKAASWVEEQGSASQGGGGNRSKRRYPWGDEWGEGLCNAGGSGTATVTAHPAGASPCGCEDMLGNVQEWTGTLWGPLPAQPQVSYRDQPGGGPSITDPAELPAQARMVHRGGSYKSQPGELRCSARSSAAPGSKIPWLGFRVAMEV
jgi:formylglycine-generating enzyme required for sulfatase activity